MTQTKRLLSIDVFRSITMFFMLFVNDLSGVLHIPLWIDHVKANEDGMHFADTIFPIFLFISGLSIPLALGKRMADGATFSDTALHILKRSFALIAMGFFHVNMENYNDASFLPIGVWELLLTLSFFLIWITYPDSFSRIKKNILIGTGVVILIILAILFKGGTFIKPIGLRPYWWGILGIIGWAYFICATIFFLCKGNLKILLLFLTIFLCLNIYVHQTVFEIDFDINLWIIKDGSSLFIMMAGIIISVLHTKFVNSGNVKIMWFTFTLTGLLLISAGFTIRPYSEGISKIHSTPAWIFICTGIAVFIFEFLIWLIDIKGKYDWFKIIKPAGIGTLTCYLLPYLIFAIYQITDFSYPDWLNEGAGGILRSVAMAFIVIFTAGFLEKRKIRLHI